MENKPLDQFTFHAREVSPLNDGLRLTGSRVTIGLPAVPARFYRHGWQSWSLAAWIDPSAPRAPIGAPELRYKDEDPLYALSEHPTSTWVGAAELADGRILLLGALGLGGRVELNGASLTGFYEGEGEEWFLVIGTEEQVFASYVSLLAERFGTNRAVKPPRVWCSWYSLYNWIDEASFLRALDGLTDLPFDVVQLDDGWETALGDWEANKKFPSGMSAFAEKIHRTGRRPGLWLAPLIVTLKSTLARRHPDWLLRDEQGKPVQTGLSMSGITYALDSAHPDVLAWLDGLIRKVRGWGYEYLKLDFLYAGAFPGLHYGNVPRESAYRGALRVMREAAGDAYILVCGAPILPSIGLCDGMRVGPDVTPYWINTPMSLWLNNPNHPSAQNALRTSLHRLWLQPLVHTDPDVVYFRSRHNALSEEQKGYLHDLSRLARFKATSDVPSWLKPPERQALREFLLDEPTVERLGCYRFRIAGREVDFASLVALPASRNFPPRLAFALGLYDMVVHEMIPAFWEVRMGSCLPNSRGAGKITA